MQFQPLLPALVLLFFVAQPAFAWRLPTNLKNSDLNEITQTLGYGTSTKFLDNPYPLGGHSGFEFSLSSQFIDTTSVSRLGSGNGNETSFQNNILSFGKGLYHNVDVFFNFVPFSSSSDVSEYGGLVKWAFYEAQSLPVTTSILAHFNSIDIDDQFTNLTSGWDLMAGWNLKNYALYFGGGMLYGGSRFMNGILDLSDPGNAPANPSNSPSKGYLTENGNRDHEFFGMEVELKPFFVAAQVDSYEELVYSLKLGYRM